MDVVFVILTCLMLAAAGAAMFLRSIVHCALCLTVALAGLAAFYLRLDAQFVGLAQILVYVGAVAILIVFAILLTRSDGPPVEQRLNASGLVGAAVAVLVLGVLIVSILSSPSVRRELPDVPQSSVREIGERMMTDYVLPLEVVGVLLTAALIGAAIIGQREGADGK